MGGGGNVIKVIHANMLSAICLRKISYAVFSVEHSSWIFCSGFLKYIYGAKVSLILLASLGKETVFSYRNTFTVVKVIHCLTTHLNAETMDTFIVCSWLEVCHANKGDKDSVYESTKPSALISPLLNIMSEFLRTLQWFQSKSLQAFKHSSIQGLVQSQNFFGHIYLHWINWKVFQNWCSL